jgi:hypothetical protein
MEIPVDTLKAVGVNELFGVVTVDLYFTTDLNNLRFLRYPSGMSWILWSIISFGTNTSAVSVTSNGLVDVHTTYRVPDKDRKGVWSLVCTDDFPAFF